MTGADPYERCEAGGTGKGLRGEAQQVLFFPKFTTHLKQVSTIISAIITPADPPLTSQAGRRAGRRAKKGKA